MEVSEQSHSRTVIIRRRQQPSSSHSSRGVQLLLTSKTDFVSGDSGGSIEFIADDREGRKKGRVHSSSKHRHSSSLHHSGTLKQRKRRLKKTKQHDKQKAEHDYQHHSSKHSQKKRTRKTHRRSDSDGELSSLSSPHLYDYHHRKPPDKIDVNGDLYIRYDKHRSVRNELAKENRRLSDHLIKHGMMESDSGELSAPPTSILSSSSKKTTVHRDDDDGTEMGSKHKSEESLAAEFDEARMHLFEEWQSAMRKCTALSRELESEKHMRHRLQEYLDASLMNQSAKKSDEQGSAQQRGLSVMPSSIMSLSDLMNAMNRLLESIDEAMLVTSGVMSWTSELDTIDNEATVMAVGLQRIDECLRDLSRPLHWRDIAHSSHPHSHSHSVSSFPASGISASSHSLRKRIESLTILECFPVAREYTSSPLSKDVPIFSESKLTRLIRNHSRTVSRLAALLKHVRSSLMNIRDYHVRSSVEKKEEMSGMLRVGLDRHKSADRTTAETSVPEFPSVLDDSMTNTPDRETSVTRLQLSQEQVSSDLPPLPADKKTKRISEAGGSSGASASGMVGSSTVSFVVGSPGMAVPPYTKPSPLTPLTPMTPLSTRPRSARKRHPSGSVSSAISTSGILSPPPAMAEGVIGMGIRGDGMPPSDLSSSEEDHSYDDGTRVQSPDQSRTQVFDSPAMRAVPRRGSPLPPPPARAHSGHTKTFSRTLHSPFLPETRANRAMTAEYEQSIRGFVADDSSMMDDIVGKM